MALFYLQISSVSRGAGRSAPAAAAYRSGERLRDERRATVHDYSSRRDVLHSEIFVPAQFTAAPPEWTGSRERLWNTAEQMEKRHNARVAREYQVTLPAELDPAQRVRLAQAFARDISDRYKVAVDLAVHAPRPGGDPRNFHAHVLTTTREVTPTGLGPKAGLDLDVLERRRRGLPGHREEFIAVRALWAQHTNEALRAAGRSERVDHRSLAAQGIDREPQPRIPIWHLQRERQGLRSEYAEYVREQHRARVQAREATRAASAATPNTSSSDLEQIRRAAREAWLRLRSEQGQARDEAAERSAEDDRAL
ncbi:MAG: MobA/MobL family protein [Gammaproteobacteria bacterium]|nr:MobA/MobL family protein [Gammaproteobacteria bacterium]